MTRYRPYAAAYARLAARQRYVARDPQQEAVMDAVFGAAVRDAAEDAPPQPGGVVDQLTRRLLDRAGYVRCALDDLYGEPGGRCPHEHPLPDRKGEDGA
jgi:hypothetical protein